MLSSFENSIENFKSNIIEKVLSIAAGKVEFQEIPDKIFTPEELSQYDGNDPNKPIYISVKRIVYDVSSKRSFYTKGRVHNVLVGRDSSRLLALTSLSEDEARPDYEDLSDDEINMLNRWEKFFQKKYPVVGILAL